MKRICFIGSKETGLRAARTILESYPDVAIITLDDSNDTRSMLPEFLALGAIAIKRPSELKDRIAEIKPDLCVVVGYYWIIGPDVINMVPLGFVGIHASLLPKYRGFAPLVWQIINGEKEAGLTLFYFDDGMDTGAIVDQIRFPIGEKENIKDVLDKSEPLIINLLMANLPKILDGTAPRIKQDHSVASYGARRTPEDGLIDWNMTAYEIHNFIRAQSTPYPGAYTIVRSEKMYIHESTMFPHEYYGVPGLVAQITGDSAIITCKKGAIKVKNENNLLKFGMRLK